MSYDYNLYLDTPTASNAERAILRVVGFSRTAHGEALVAPGLWATCWSLQPATFDATFGINRRVSVTFAPDKFEGHTVGIRNMVKVIDSLLTEISGNLVLLGNGETSLLVRDAAGLAIDPGSDFWTHYGVLALITHRFQRRTLPDL